MEKEKVLKFNQDDEFYFNMGKEYLQNGDIVKSIKYIHKAIEALKGKNEFLESSYNLFLAQAYGQIHNFKLSDYYFFTCLDSQIFAQIAYRGLGENFLIKNELNTARYYLKKCIDLIEDSQIADSAKFRLEMIDKKKHKGFTIVKNVEEVKEEIKDSITDIYMSRGMFSQAIETFEEQKKFDDPKVRTDLSLAYFFDGQYKKGIEFLKTYGEEDNVLDLCSLLLMYKGEGDEENFNQTKNKLRKIENLKLEENFKIGLAFAETEEYDLAKLYMQRYLSVIKHDQNFEFLYAITCINAKDYDEAKLKLIDLKTINPYASYIIDYYLNVCEYKIDRKFECVFNVPIEEFLVVKNKMKEWLTLDNKALKEEFSEYKNMFYYVASLNEGKVKNSVLYKLSKLEGKEITDYFRFVLLYNSANMLPSTKINLALNRLNLDNINTVSLVKNKFYTNIVLPYKKATKLINPKMSEASIKVVEYLLTKEKPLFNINLKRNIIKLERKIGQDEIDSNILASFLTWDFVSKQKDVNSTLRKILEHFNITQEDFYKFVEKYSLEV